MSATYDFDWRTTLKEFVDSLSGLGISEIEKIDENEVQVDW